MQFNWNADTMRWYIDANNYTGFYKNVAETIAPALSGYKSLCDIGCGLGLFDFEVASLFEKIECLDINETALSSIRERAATMGIKHIITRMQDAEQLCGGWDVLYSSFFGSCALNRFLPHCKKMFAVVTVTPESEMFPIKQPYKKNNVHDTIKHLVNNNIKYKLTYKQFEFGQPVASMDEARCCIKSYSPDISDADLDDFLQRRTKETGSDVFPYFIPRAKSIGIFELDGALK